MLPKLYVNGFSCLIADATAEDFTPFVDVRKLRRAEQVSKNVLLCAFRALQQAQIEPSAQENLGISLAMGAGALGSTLKFMDSIIEDGDELSSPTAFASSVHNFTSLMLSMFLHIHGPCVVTGQLDSSLGGALLSAQQFLFKRMCLQVLVALTEDVNPLLVSVLEKNPAQFDPYIYQPACPPQRVAGALLVSAEPTKNTQFVLRDIALSRTEDVRAATQEKVPVQSCAHSLLLLNNSLQTKASFDLREQFAGTILGVKGEPYVLS